MHFENNNFFSHFNTKKSGNYSINEVRLVLEGSLQSKKRDLKNEIKQIDAIINKIKA